ncbi:alpha/beta hydrolase [Acanthopleuribacter pedis]|nr:alpha/beta hydrolase [Acanthopleuribacter pedis]
MTQLISLLLQGLRLTAIAVAIFMAVLFFAQRYLIFPAPREPLPNPLPADVTRIELGQTYGLFLNAAKTEHDRRPLIIFAHGNAECAHHWIDSFRWYREQGISVLLLEFPGYAAAGGSPSFDSLREAVLSGYDTMVARADIDPAAVIAYGRSIGGGPIGLLAEERPVAALILESSFASLKDLVYHHRNPGFLLRDRFDNGPIVAALEIPVLLVHGTQDRIIPIKFAHQLRDLAADATFHELACDHNNCPPPLSYVRKFLHEKTAIRLAENPDG